MMWYNLPSTQNTHFKSNKTKLEDLSQKDWAILLGLCHIFKPFAVATNELSAEKDSTITAVAPTVNYLAGVLNRKKLWDKPKSDTIPKNKQSEYKHKLYIKHEGTPHFNEVINLLKDMQEHMRIKFVERFGLLIVYRIGIRSELAWTTLLNPKEWSLWILQEH
jgi:hypothetical protein